VPRTSLFRTSSFRIAAIYLGLFSASVAALGATVYVAVRSEESAEIDGDIARESTALAREYSARGPERLQALIEARGGEASSFAYGLVDADGHPLAGDLAPPGATLGWVYLPAQPRRDAPATARALVTRLDGGERLVVADAWRAAHGPTRAVVVAFLWALAGTLALGTLGGVILSVQILRRIDAMTRAAQDIVAGDWRRRIPEAGADDELAQLARTFNRMFDRIQSLLEAHKNAGAAIAHDLRRPLARTLRRLEAARGDNAGAAATKAAIARAIADIDGVLETFSAILRIGQIESGARRAGFKPVDLADVARDVVDAFLPAAEEGGRTLAADLVVALPLSGDRELLAQMVANLIDNALRHTPPGARVAATSARSEDELSLTIADDGPGAPDSELKRIFERFYRLDAARATPGDGLGLSLVAAVAELHGMTCRARDNRPGLAVVLTLPASRAGRR
jgi:signal transduction histidine kinase